MGSPGASGWPVAWQMLLRDRLPMSGMQLDARHLFEHYVSADEYDAKTGVFTCAPCLPVSKLR